MNTSTELTENARLGARKALLECLQLHPHDTLAVFSDETTAQAAELIIDEASKVPLRVVRRQVSLIHQLEFEPSRGLCRGCQAALEGAAGILTCLSDSTETTAYRRELLRRGANGSTRLGHMPGASLFVLASAVNLDYEQAVQRCDNLTLALTLGNEVRLQTYVFDAAGAIRSAHVLKIEIGGLRRFPVTSTGIVAAGTWGNLPGGETFVAPIEDVADGEFVLNGAFKGRVLKSPEALLLRFQGGRLIGVDGERRLVEQFELLFKAARMAGDPNYNVLAELGIGVNTGIEELIGNSLFDEKCAGTVHIALGDSSGFGGNYQATVHEDLVSRKPSVWIDDKLIIERGEDRFRAEDWREDISSFPVADIFLNGNPRITRTPERVEIRQGLLKVRHRVAAGRICSYTVGNLATSKILSVLYHRIPDVTQSRLEQIVKDVAFEAGISASDCRAGLSVLLKHKLVSIYP